MLSGIPKPHILDLGRLNGANIEFMIQKGFKVYVDDRITDLKPTPPPPPPSRSEKKKAAPAPLEPLEYDPALFDAVLCWDLFDYLVAKQAQELIGGIAKVLKPKGLLLAFFFGNRTTSPPPVRYRILQADQLEYKPLSQNLSRRIYENREIQELFSGFDTVNSCFLINQMREVLVQRRPG
jgi:SAM-dependent methyltransferase